MKSLVINLINISITFFLSLYGGSMTLAQSTQCECSDPPGGRVTCEAGQIPICIVRDGKVNSLCKTPPSSINTNDERNAYLLSIILEKGVTVEEIKNNQEYQKILTHGRIGTAQNTTTFESSGAETAVDEVSQLCKLRVPPNVEESAQQDPENPYYHFNRSTVLFDQGKYVEAEAEARKAIEKSQNQKPILGQMLNNLAAITFRQARFSEAEALLRRAIQLAPRNPCFLYNLANMLANQDKYSEAEILSREAVRLNPQVGDFQNLLGNILLHQKRYGEAEAVFRAAVRVKPGLLLGYQYLTITLFRQTKYAEAEDFSRKAVRLRFNDAWFSVTLGLNYLNKHQYKEAESQFRRALQLEPQNAFFREALNVAISRQN